MEVFSLPHIFRSFSTSSQKLSELSGIDYKHIQLLESKRPPRARIDTLEKLAKAFNTSISKLLDF